MEVCVEGWEGEGGGKVAAGNQTATTMSDI